jgi:23S rRNA pseudouridine2457 synthase
LILFNKPYGVVCQFSAHPSRPTLKDFLPIPGIYPAGRLDWDSEGLLILTDDGRVQHQIADPRQKMEKVYWAQVEGEPTEVALKRLRTGVDLGDFITRHAAVTRIAEPQTLWHREPPIRYRAAIPAPWLEIRITEGKNRQVRRMTAAIGHPTLRLVRVTVGPWTLAALQPGQYRHEAASFAYK